MENQHVRANGFQYSRRASAKVWTLNVFSVSSVPKRYQVSKRNGTMSRVARGSLAEIQVSEDTLASELQEWTKREGDIWIKLCGWQ